MPMKEWIYRLQPVQLYIVLVLSIFYFLVQLFLSHISHALVLLVDSYHMLCNIIALSGCILTIKHSKKTPRSVEPCTRLNTSASQNSIDPAESENRFIEVPLPQNGDNSSSTSDIVALKQLKPTSLEEDATNVKQKVKAKSRQQRENSLKNTFGWTRIDVLTMLVVCIFLASFCFSAVVEALQTLSHIHHQDAMHFPIPVLILGSMGIILNGFCYLLIGGYTYHQGSFLYITSSGTVILDRVVTGDGIRKGERRLSGSRRHMATTAFGSHKRQSVRELMRDICSTIFVIVCSMIVHYTNEDEDTSKFVDPLCSIMSCVVLMTLSYPYMKESGMILLQTIPDTIDIDIFEQSLLKTFPDVSGVHDLHIWRLSGQQYVATAHIIFEDPKVYSVINDMLINFFHDQGISKVTIQPEFKTKLPVLPLLAPPTATPGSSCLMQCRQEACLQKHCCEGIIKDDGKKSPATKSSNSTSKEHLEQIPMEIQHRSIEAGTSHTEVPSDEPEAKPTVICLTVAIINEAQVPVCSTSASTKDGDC
ncbi:calcium/manganese antiporter SLC30A10 [Ochlerotatus camptorhynchus]|uniref:calcium/manganese antiporter SLC30A10 n=1 Tax=Ochlerotatus camptorhynchus TaxID=644619 RepID=UPI0031DA6907